jgi:hypothetical protein
MRTLDEILADARDVPAFSNSTMGEIWTANWCARCKNDSQELADRGKGCPLILVSLMNKTPIEWLTANDHAGIVGDYHCIEFRDERGDGGPKPPPKPMPGQGELFDGELHRGVRMYKDVVDELRRESVSS